VAGDRGAGERGQNIQGGRDALVAGRDLVIQGMPQPIARSAYLQQVRRIAPPSLVDREAELAALARFCLQPEGAPYVWWRAGPWAGKSALLSTFVLRPPPEVVDKVQFVSFFITARLAAQDTREAFTEVLLEQLAALLGQSLPSVLPETTREAFLLSLLSDAASMCQDAGRRLVLVVDGLDEDRGVTTGPGAHSIAGLLPADPPSGMRVIVAGRLNPPVPDDVPDWHPLRDPTIVRPLPISPHAQDMGRLGRQELQRLLHGSPAELDVLGLLTAARGGLSAWDLAELTAVSRWEIMDILRAATGRTLLSRPSFLEPATRPDVYLLGHEELHAAATEYLGDTLAAYRGRLHAWAARFRADRWPPITPEYLLAGYFRLMDDLHDLPRVIEFALDEARHDLMLNVTGGDAAALAEIRIALDRIAAQAEPDLTDALALAIHRDRLTDRNAHIPFKLPAVWAALGQMPRAQALAASITDPWSQTRALAESAAVLARAGDKQQAAAMVARMEELAGSPPFSGDQAFMLADFAVVLAEVGERQRALAIAAHAETAARSIRNPSDRASAVAEVTVALAAAGEHEQAAAMAREADALVRSITDDDWQDRSLAGVAEALARAGEHQRAEALIRSISEEHYVVQALAVVAQTLASAGEYRQSVAVADRAESAARSISDPGNQAFALAFVAGALAEAGDADRAEALARTITQSSDQARALAHVVAALAHFGKHLRAEALAQTITDLRYKAQALADIAGTLAENGHHHQAEALARTITTAHEQSKALTDVAAALAKAGKHELAATMAIQAESAARSIADSQAEALAEVASALAQAGEYEPAVAMATRAESLAYSFTSTGERGWVLARIVVALADAKEYERAETLARSIDSSYHRRNAVADIAVKLVEAGKYQRAESIAGSLIGSSYMDNAVIDVVAALAEAGQHQRAVVVATQVEDAARSITGSYARPMALAATARALAKAGEYQRAEAIARSLTDPYFGASALAEVAVVLAESEGNQRAIIMAAEAEASAKAIQSSHSRAGVMADVAVALAKAGEHQRAEATACAIINWHWVSPNHRADALTGVAVAFAEAGKHEQAVTLARTITDPYQHASALADIAMVLARANEVSSASRVTAELCAIGHWRTAMRPVLVLAPSASAMLADAMSPKPTGVRKTLGIAAGAG
jgi:hypothetical protein